MEKSFRLFTVLFLISIIFLTVPLFVHAQANTQLSIQDESNFNLFNIGNNNQWGNFFENFWNHKKDKDNDDCDKNPEKGECNVDVPEFGVIPGTIAFIGSAGTFVLLRKKRLI